MTDFTRRSLNNKEMSANSSEAPANNQNRKDFRLEFLNIAKAYRFRERLVTLVGVLALLLFALAYLYPEVRQICIYGFCLLLASLGAALIAPVNLKCPACEKNADENGLFCPECGAESMQAGSFTRFRGCESCGRKMARGKMNARRFKIRFCQRCGVHLDENGV